MLRVPVCVLGCYSSDVPDLYGHNNGPVQHGSESCADRVNKFGIFG
jgi:hypothetical protein